MRMDLCFQQLQLSSGVFPKYCDFFFGFLVIVLQHLAKEENGTAHQGTVVEEVGDNKPEIDIQPLGLFEEQIYLRIPYRCLCDKRNKCKGNRFPYQLR